MRIKTALLFPVLLQCLCSLTFSIKVFRQLDILKIQPQQHYGIINIRGGERTESDVDRRQVQKLGDQTEDNENDVDEDDEETHLADHHSKDDHGSTESGDDFYISQTGGDQQHIENRLSEVELDDTVEDSTDANHNPDDNNILIDQTAESILLEDVGIADEEEELEEIDHDAFDPNSDIDESIITQDDEEDVVKAQEDAFADVTAIDEDEDATDYFGVSRNNLIEDSSSKEEESVDDETLVVTDIDVSTLDNDDGACVYDFSDTQIQSLQDNTEEINMKSNEQERKKNPSSMNNDESNGYDIYHVSESGNSEQVQTWYAHMEEDETSKLEDSQEESTEGVNVEAIAKMEPASTVNPTNDSSDEIDYPSFSDSTAFDRMDLADAYDDDETSLEETDVINEDESKAIDQFSSTSPTALQTSMSRGDGRTVEYMITQNMRKVLIRELGYTNQEINKMKPDVATVIVSKMLKRPKNGVPAEFYVDGSVVSNSQGKKWDLNYRRFLKRLIVPGSIGIISIGLALIGGVLESSTEEEEFACGYPSDKVQVEGSERSLKPQTTDISRPREQVSPSGDASLVDDTEDEVLKPVEEEIVNATDKDLDKTWLDRAITTVLEKLDEARKRPF